ncbi:MAG: alpha/beta hydrolase [Luteibaculaceae bacterium]
MQIIKSIGLIIWLFQILITTQIFSQNIPTTQSDSENEANTIQSKTIVFLHGLFQNSTSWEHWAPYFSDLGYTVYTPSFPYHEGEPKLLRQHINPNLVNLEFKEVLDSMASFIEKLSEKPIVIGHSMGGLLAQKLVEAGMVEIGITLASANPRGISVSDWKFIRSNFRMVNPFRNRNKICTPPMKWFNYTFFNTLSDSMAREAHSNYFIPESRKIAKSSTQRGLEIDFSKPHVPLLFIAGEKDNDLPPRLIFKNYNAYQDSSSVKAYYEFPNKSHYIVGEPNWEDVANYVANWIEKNR